MCDPYIAACHLTKCDIINEVKLFPTVYFLYTQDVLLQFSDIIQSDVRLQKQVHILYVGN